MPRSCVCSGSADTVGMYYALRPDTFAVYHQHVARRPIRLRAQQPKIGEDSAVPERQTAPSVFAR